MNVYQMSLVAVMGLCIAMAGASRLVGDSVWPFVIGMALCVAFLVQSVRSLQRQIDALQARLGSEAAGREEQ